MEDDLIDKLIEIHGAFGPNPERRRFTGFDWKQTHKLKPKGDAARHKMLSESLQPKTENLTNGI